MQMRDLYEKSTARARGADPWWLVLGLRPHHVLTPVWAARLPKSISTCWVPGFSAMFGHAPKELNVACAL